MGMISQFKLGYKRAQGIRKHGIEEEKKKVFYSQTPEGGQSQVNLDKFERVRKESQDSDNLRMTCF